MRHQMFTAFPSRKAARLYGLNRNHQVRVWCSCMDNPTSEPGTYAGQSTGANIPRSTSARDPRRLGSWDWLGVADVRIPGSALEIFERHVRECSTRALEDR